MCVCVCRVQHIFPPVQCIWTGVEGHVCSGRNAALSDWTMSSWVSTLWLLLWTTGDRKPRRPTGPVRTHKNTHFYTGKNAGISHTHTHWLAVYVKNVTVIVRLYSVLKLLCPDCPWRVSVSGAVFCSSAVWRSLVCWAAEKTENSTLRSAAKKESLDVRHYTRESMQKPSYFTMKLRSVLC